MVCHASPLSGRVSVATFYLSRQGITSQMQFVDINSEGGGFEELGDQRAHLLIII